MGKVSTTPVNPVGPMIADFPPYLPAHLQRQLVSWVRTMPPALTAYLLHNFGDQVGRVQFSLSPVVQTLSFNVWKLPTTPPASKTTRPRRSNAKPAASGRQT